MEHKGKNRFGLIGRNISYSFSRGYFGKKFEELKLHGHSYENFDLEQISDFKELVNREKNLKGCNVTIPYKEAIIPYLESLDPKAQSIGAVNTIKFTKKGLKGYNTDIYGFEKSIAPFLKPHHKKALVLGTGGASKAVAFVFKTLDIAFKYVSRNPKKGQLSYDDITAEILDDYTILVNCTPLGTFPNVTDRPDIPYEHLTERHLLFDLIYNPEKTAFLLAGEKQGASICNGLRMLELQAEKAWEIWNSP